MAVVSTVDVELPAPVLSLSSFFLGGFFAQQARHFILLVLEALVVCRIGLHQVGGEPLAAVLQM
jgi:hypothetical protein